MQKLVVLEGDRNADNISKIANFLGIETTTLSELPAEPHAIMLSGQLYDQYQETLDTRLHQVFLYNASASTTLSNRFQPFNYQAQAVHITYQDTDFTTYLSGLSLTDASSQTVFQNSDEFLPLILADEYPMLVKWRGMYVSAAADVRDIDEFVPKYCEPHRAFFSGLIPLVLFIKWAFKEQCWHLKTRTACITIDDPLLQPTYGFIQFDEFQQWLERHNLAATFAFIPRNYRRSNPSIVELFKQHAEQLSICVHGCNHTDWEFGGTDSHHLRQLALTALHKMELHQARYAMPYDPIMIFPQGKYSSQALDALRTLGYKAVVGSGVYTTNYQNSLRIRDVLDLAVYFDSGLPTYRRRYPTDIFDFACDMLFEKPIIITQHHDDFREGLQPLTSFIAKLQTLEPRLQWMPLDRLLDATVWQRVDTTGQVIECKPVMNSFDNLPALQQEMRQLQTSWRENLRHNVRLYLMTFRDNVLHKHPALIQRLKQLLRLRPAKRATA